MFECDLAVAICELITKELINIFTLKMEIKDIDDLDVN